MARELLVKPLGLVTRPNIYGQYPVGGMLTAQNLVMRSPGIIETAPALVAGVSMGAANNVVHDLFPLDGGRMSSLARTGVGVWTAYIDSTASTYRTPLNSLQYSNTGRITTTRARGRVFYNSISQGTGVIDSTNPTPPAVIRMAGLQQPKIYTVNSTTTNAVAIVNNACVGYAVCTRRIQSDGYEIASKPSLIYIYRNTSGSTQNILLTVLAEASQGLIADDYVELYRTNILFNSVVTSDPGTTLQLIASVQLTAADLAAAFVTLTDDTLPGPLGVTSGRALYTNPGQKGLLGGHRLPDIAECVTNFKQYTFLGNVLERPRLEFQIPSGHGTTELAQWDNAAFRANGIGLRTVTGVVTIGSANITGVSATHMLGIVQGQVYFAGSGGAAFPAGTTVSSAAGATITMSAVATASGTGISLNDRIEIAGVNFELFRSPQDFARLLGVILGNAQTEVTTNSALFAVEDPTLGLTTITWIIEPIRPNTGVTWTVRATNGQNYSPPLTQYNLTATTLPYTRTKNMIRWSNDSQPEHFPAPNEDSVGNAEIIALEATRDALWIFCTDGLFRLSGAGGQWRLDTADTTIVLASPRASCVLKEAVYAYTNQGLVRITDAGTENLSEQIVGDILPGAEYSETASIIVERNEAEDEIVIRLDATQCYVYSVREGSFTTVLFTDVTAMAYARYPASGLPTLAVGQSPAGSAPSYSLWNATASFLAPTARFHPLFAQDPFASKQWIDGTFIFDVASIGKSLTPAWNGTASPAALLKGGAQYFNESRSTLGVPRRAAIGHTLAPGYAFGALSTATKMYALSMRFRQLAEQNLHR